MNYLEVRIATAQAAVEAVGDALMALGSQGVVLSEIQADAGVDPISTVKAYFPDLPGAEETLRRDVIEQLDGLVASIPELSPYGLEMGRVAEEDWAHSWKAFWHVQHIGEHLVVRPSWETYELQPEDRVITLDPKQAFGTGTHATTRLCMIALERLARNYRGQKVADIGTGSGILSVVAALMGAAEVEALDTDPVAVLAAVENFELNGVGDRCHAALGSASDLQGPARVVVANILAEVIVAIAADLARATLPGGLLIASGIILPRVGMVQEALAGAGFMLAPPLIEGDWVAMIGRRETV